jgi:hypothetical protein
LYLLPAESALLSLVHILRGKDSKSPIVDEFTDEPEQTPRPGLAKEQKVIPVAILFISSLDAVHPKEHLLDLVGPNPVALPEVLAVILIPIQRLNDTWHTVHSRNADR